MEQLVLLTSMGVLGFLSLALTVYSSVYANKTFADNLNYSEPLLTKANKGKALTIWLIIAAFLQLICAWFTAWYVYLT